MPKIRAYPGELAWQAWAVTEVLLGLGLAGHPEGFLGAMALTVVQGVVFLVLRRSPTAFPVQVRLAYLLLLGAAWWAPWVYWLPFGGTAALLVFDYCPMARCLSLLPGNRRAPLSLALLGWTLASPPGSGSILEAQAAWHAARAGGAA